MCVHSFYWTLHFTKLFEFHGWPLLLLLFSHSVLSDSLQPMACSVPGLPVPDHLPEFAQVHVHCISDTVQPSHPLTPSSPSAPKLSQHQGLFQWVGSSHQMPQIPELQLKHQPFQWIFRVDCPLNWLVWSPCCPRDFQKSSSAPQFEGISFAVLGLFYCPALISVHDYWKNNSFVCMDVCRQSNVCF